VSIDGEVTLSGDSASGTVSVVGTAEMDGDGTGQSDTLDSSLVVAHCPEYEAIAEQVS